MLDIKFIRENVEKIQEAAKNKNIDIDMKKLLFLDNERRRLQTKLDEFRAKRNAISKLAKGKKPTQEQIKKGKELKKEIARFEEQYKKIDNEYIELMAKVPNIPSKDTPIGKGEDDNVELYRWKEPTKFDFQPKTYIELAKEHDLIDFERGVKVAGYRGYYIKNEAAMLQMAMMMYALEKLIQNGFSPMIPPTLVREFALFGSGYFASKEYNPEIDEIYKIANEEKLPDGSLKKENKFLVGTAEPSLLAYYANEILDEKDLPIKICGFSQCYRSEIGSYGKDTQGIYRVHEFMKVEQVCITKADIKASDIVHNEMVKISEEILQDLGLPYRKIQICTGDMGAGKYKMFDLEVWIPSRNSYGEVGSASNFLDWQSRRLNVKYKDFNGNKKYVYMLNNTGLASVRPLIAILENYQQKDGSIRIPNALKKYMPIGIERIQKRGLRL